MISEVFNMDCMDGMKQFPDKYFELAIVDPPYGIGDFTMEGVVKGKMGIKIKPKKWEYEWNNVRPDSNYFDELKRVSKHQIIWGANYFNCFDRGGAIVWFKDVSHPSMSKCEIASNSMFKKVDYVRIDWSSLDKFQSLKGLDTHPCEKPVSLYKWLLKNYAKEGDKILDTHMGSQSSRIAAFDMGFDYWGYEIDVDYFREGNKRFELFKSQLKLSFA